MEQHTEHEITGRGSMNRVWVVGDTIRRERGQHSDTIACLLRHLERKGFRFSPRHRGVDEANRDILTRLPGEPVPTLRGYEQLREVGELLRDFHTDVADFVPEPCARWRTVRFGQGRRETVVHGDIAPWNLLEEREHIVGLVDWDTARPGDRIEDFAYTAWHFVPLHDEPMGIGGQGPPISERPRRLRFLCDTYGLAAGERANLLSEIAAMQVRHAAMVADTAMCGDYAMRRLWAGGRFTVAPARALLWLDEHRAELSESLE